MRRSFAFLEADSKGKGQDNRINARRERMMIPNFEVNIRPRLSKSICQSATHIETGRGYRSRSNRHICGINAVYTLHIPPVPKRHTDGTLLQDRLLSLEGAAVPSSAPNQISSFS